MDSMLTEVRVWVVVFLFCGRSSGQKEQQWVQAVPGAMTDMQALHPSRQDVNATENTVRTYSTSPIG